MNPDQQRTEIAEVWGFEPGTINRESWLGYCTPIHAETLYQLGYDAEDSDEKPNHILAKVPNFLGDLNAMHEAEKAISGSYLRFEANLNDICLRDWRGTGPEQPYSNSFPCHATAAQRAEAFLRCVGAWKEEEPHA